MTSTPKLKVSLTLSADLMSLIDRDVRQRRSTRSGVIEDWLRRAAHAAAEREVEHATAAYYLSLLEGERVEDEALARGLSAAARRVSHGGAMRAPGRRHRP
jgi:metal-responsive CopG/Arc/MetJ family transcriptional regulator